jgi:hypothetical protein
MSGVLTTLDDVIARGGDADDVLRAVVDLLVAEPEVRWAGIHFAEEGDLALGPAAGAENEAQAVRAAIMYRDEPVGELEVHGDVDPELLVSIAERISPYVLLGWDTGGEAWEP